MKKRIVFIYHSRFHALDLLCGSVGTKLGHTNITSFSNSVTVVCRKWHLSLSCDREVIWHCVTILYKAVILIDFIPTSVDCGIKLTSFWITSHPIACSSSVIITTRCIISSIIIVCSHSQCPQNYDMMTLYVLL